MEPREGIIRIKNGVRVFAAKIVFYVFARERCATTYHGILQAQPLQILDHVLHLQGGLHQQSTEPDRLSAVFLCCRDNSVGRLLNSQIHDLVAVVAENDVH